MTLNEQIAERLGWRWLATVHPRGLNHPDGGRVKALFAPDQSPGEKWGPLDGTERNCSEEWLLRATWPPPDWSTSRDAIHRDLLPRLTEEQWPRFLFCITQKMGALSEDCFRWTSGGYVGSGIKGLRFFMEATPEQLCRAFLAATEPKS